VASALRRLWFSPAVVGPLLIARHAYRHRQIPPLWAPRNFNDKVLHRLVFDRRPLLSQVAGKLEAREHLLSRTGDPSLLIDLIGTARNAAELAALQLPPAFIAKPNHLSGFTHIHRGPEPPDVTAIGTKLSAWSSHVGRTEWAYSGVQRVCIIERLMLDAGTIPSDYKFWCYDGRVHFVGVSTTRFEDLRNDFFHPDWTWIDGMNAYPPADRRPTRPALLAEMTELAEALSHGFDFARVDLYAIDGGIKLGEITLYPNRGLGRFDPPSMGDLFGAPWQLPKLARTNGMPQI